MYVQIINSMRSEVSKTITIMRQQQLSKQSKYSRILLSCQLGKVEVHISHGAKMYFYIQLCVITINLFQKCHNKICCLLYLTINDRDISGFSLKGTLTKKKLSNNSNHSRTLAVMAIQIFFFLVFFFALLTSHTRSASTA